MPYAVEIKNPFASASSADKRTVPAGTTIREAADLFAGHGNEFEYPTVAFHNSEPVMRDQWQETRIAESDVLSFVLVPQGGFIGGLLLNILVAAVVGLAFALTVSSPDDFEQSEADPVYFLSGQKNQIKLGQPIPSPYGRPRMFPPYAARPYSKFINNDQFLYQLFCLGHGEYGTIVQQIEDTAIASFEEITTEIYGPGDTVTLFPDNVETSSEVSSIELYGTNEPEFQVFGGYTANSAGTVTTQIDIDVVFPQGLYEAENDGSFSNATVTALFEYREIDDTGTPVGSWSTLNSFSKTLNTNQPQRFTLENTVASGRYEVRGERTNAKSSDTLVQDRIQWYQMRSILPSTKNYGDVTLIAMKARATNNLNSNTQSKFNVQATRKLPIYDGVSWSAATETRNPVWAVCDMLRSTYGANLADSKIDLDQMVTVAAAIETAGENFDWVYDTKINIWDAMKLALRVGRASPVVNLTQVSAVRDEPRSVPVIAYSPDSIIKDSLRWQVRLQPDDDFDGIEVEYLDSDTWKQETVEALIGTDAGTKTQKIRFPGITDRDKAIQAGYYIRAQQVFQRETVSFETGPDGAIPSYGDLIAVSHDLPRWGAWGTIDSIDGDGVTVNLSHSLSGVSGNTIGIRNKYGAIVGPYTCAKSATNEFQVVATSSIDQTDLDFDDEHTPHAYYFGQADMIYKLCVVTQVTSDSDDVYSITAVNYDDRIYDYEGRTATPLETANIPAGIPTLPTVEGLTITVDPNTETEAVVGWVKAVGASYYLLQRSDDGTTWSGEQFVTGNAITLYELNPTQIYVRVAAVGSAQGPWVSTSAAVGVETRVDSFGNVRGLSNGEQRYIVEI